MELLNSSSLIFISQLYFYTNCLISILIQVISVLSNNCINTCHYKMLHFNILEALESLCLREILQIHTNTYSLIIIFEINDKVTILNHIPLYF